ncbi:unnamed protein product [Acanthoscelides obtectus]|uniref:Uncharacterized protein n=1 Tax=Acanthoscelides obtectus TaxID=200917 RepID=A0A9P0M9Z6_ACAOB|nr:unnamed protein product [Acanthoscelides obtectus]CAK1641011.1 hypothetical protein AOBTE_LOCUS12078 [Acanthoscelides obtectus]
MSRVIEADRNTHGKPRVSKPRLLGKPPDQRKKFVQHTEPIKPKPIKSGPFKEHPMRYTGNFPWKQSYYQAGNDK